MTGDFSVQPKQSNNNAKIVMWIFFGISAALFATSALFKQMGWGYAGVISTAGLISIVTAILMYTKYLSVKFYYDVLVTGVDEPLFVVRQLVGKREMTLARVALADIVDIKRETSEERRAHKRDKMTALYIYAPTLSPAVSYRMLVRSYSERSEIILEGSDEFFAKLTELSREARIMRNDEEEY